MFTHCKNELKVKECLLDNGLTVWLNEDHSQPKVFGSVVVKAGAKDCPDTGIAHYFEHMMFKGTDKIGTLNYEKEKKILQDIEGKYDELAVTTDRARRELIQKEINELDKQCAEYIIPNEFNKLITRYGGSGLNAATSYDSTIYFNTFSPQYIEQWMKINSERLLNPVFRLFRNELETVYEEKNMRSDIIGGKVMDKLLERYFGDHPYAYPIIGSTDNLKNPSLKQMRAFFNKYYVAGNMALILSGDFDAEEVMPIVEKYFSRIKSGNPKCTEKKALKQFDGKEKMKVKFPVPFLKGMAMGFRGISSSNPDRRALAIAVGLLNNANGTGYLDTLMVEHKLIGALAINENMNDAGILAVAVVPKNFIQSYDSVEKMVWGQINKLKQGDFTDELFNSVKLEYKRKAMTALEDINSRAQVMMRIYSQGKTWNDYLADLRRIDEITRDDVVRVANKYFTDNYLCATKSTGKYGKDDLPKPDLDPIRPKHSEESSSFAKELESISVGKVEHRFLDFDKDTHRVKLAESVNLFVTSNNINDIFTFDIYFAAGSLQHPAAGILANYLQYIGTENASYSEFQYKLQSVGSTMTFDSAKDWFVIRITGFDAYFEQTLRLMREFMTEAKADDKKLKPIVDEAKIAEKTFFKSSQNVAAAIMEKVRYGEESRFLRKLSLSETKKLKGETLLSLFKEMQSVARDYHYCGTLDSSVVEKAIKDIFPSDGIDKDSVSPYFRPYVRYDKPVVYFYNMPDASQSVILTSVLGDEMKDYRQRCAGRLFSIYFGGDMSSLMFQEIREYRSLAYMANGRMLLPSVTDKEPLFSFSTTMSTQCDKTLDAMSVLSNLIEYMPLKPERFQYIKQVALNSMHSNYPTFREVSERIANLRAQGFEEDPKLILFRNLETMSMDDVNDFYLGNVKGRIPVYVVVGNKKKIDMKKLSAYGKIINLKKKDIYN